jgi:hypothetical protein
VLSLEDLELDLFGHRGTRAGKKLDLTALEFKLLEYLLRNKGRIVSRTTILEHVWEYGFDPQTNVVEAQVCRLRENWTRIMSASCSRQFGDSGMFWNRKTAWFGTVRAKMWRNQRRAYPVGIFAQLHRDLLLPARLPLGRNGREDYHFQQ